MPLQPQTFSWPTFAHAGVAILCLDFKLYQVPIIHNKINLDPNGETPALYIDSL